MKRLPLKRSHKSCEHDRRYIRCCGTVTCTARSCVGSSASLKGDALTHSLALKLTHSSLTHSLRCAHACRQHVRGSAWSPWLRVCDMVVYCRAARARHGARAACVTVRVWRPPAPPPRTRARLSQRRTRRAPRGARGGKARRTSSSAVLCCSCCDLRLTCVTVSWSRLGDLRVLL
jgi:hypothetical protein